MTDLYHVPLAAVTTAAPKAAGPITIRAPGTDNHWTWDNGWKGTGKPPKTVEVPDTYWAPPPRDMPKRPAPAKDVVHELEAIIAWWRRLYHDGVLSSRQVEGLARQTALVDTNGAVWSVGLTSGAWYRFDQDWKQTDAPDPRSIVAIEEAIANDEEAVVAGLARFFNEVEDPAPERVTVGWKG